LGFTNDAHHNEPVEVACRLLAEGYRPVPTDAAGEPLVVPPSGNGEIDEGTLRAWFELAGPGAGLGLLHADGAIEAYTPSAVAAVADDARRRRMEKTAKQKTDCGNAARLFLAHGDVLRYVPAWSTWLLWNGTHWAKDEELAIYGLAKRVALDVFAEALDFSKNSDEWKSAYRWAGQSSTRQRIESMISLVRPDLAATPAALDADPWLLNCRNGTLDLKAGELRPHRREDLISKLAPVAYDPAATCPLWLAFLDRVMAGNEELIAYLQRILGMCLTADVSEQALFIFFGPGANGKSVLLDTLTALMGDYGGEAAPDLLIVRRSDEHPTQVADLQGRRLVVAAETEEGGRLRVSLLKRLTGNARLKARFMCRDFFEFTRTHKLILATNSKPAVREGTHAVWRRLRLVPFDVVIPEPEQDKQLTSRLQVEWSGILNWLVAGCLAWQAGGLQTPDEVVDATQAYEDEQDVLGEFLDECIIFASNAHAERTVVWEVYSAWAQRRREKWPLSRTALYANLRRRERVEDTDRQIGGRKVRVFTGFALAAPRVPSPSPPGETCDPTTQGDFPY